jgi:quercetin dioxygenase-like cupin family protein
MRAPQFAVVPLLAALAVAACKDGAPTSSPSSSPSSPRAHASKRSSDGASTVAITIPPPGGFSSQVLSRGSFVDDINIMFRLKLDRATTVVHVDDPSDVVMARITFQPGGALPWHTHPGPAIASVASGELTIIGEEGCLVRRYPAGRAFIDPGQGHVHIGFNAAAVETVVYVTYLDVPTGQAPLVPVPNPGC